MKRFTVANLLVLIAVLAAGLAAMRDASDLALKIVFTLTLATLSVGLLGAIVCRRNGAWVGFALFGWGYALASWATPVENVIQPHLLTTELLESLATRVHNIPPQPPPLTFMVAMEQDASGKLVPMKFGSSRGSEPLSPSEIELVNYENDWKKKYSIKYSKMSLSGEIRRSREIGHLLLALTFAFIGANLGRFLATRDGSVRAATSSRPDPGP